MVLRVCNSESDRVKALQELFDMVLTPEEAHSIKGYPTEIQVVDAA